MKMIKNNIKKNTVINRDNLLELFVNNSINAINELNPPVSFDFLGNPISYWQDEQWDYSKDKLNAKSKKCILYLNTYSSLKESFLCEFKYLIIIIYLTNHKKYSSSEKIKNLAISLYPLIIASQNLGHSSFCEINDELQFFEVMNQIKDKYTYRTLGNILSTLKNASDIDKPYFDLHLPFKRNKSQTTSVLDIKKIAIKYSKNQSDHVEQTLYIPSKIHSNLIATCINFIEEKSKYLPSMISLLEEDYLLYEKIKIDFNISNVSTNKSKSVIGNAKRNNMAILLKKYDLEQFQTLPEIEKEIRFLAISCIILILNFSGMRINELANINIDGFKVINSEPNLYIIRSYETKISGGQTVDYITSPIVKDAFEILKSIHALAKKYDKEIDSNKLVVLGSHQKLPAYGNVKGIAAQLSYFSQELNLLIDADDVKESELLNGPREDIKPGNIWPLASHQFRRTLIVNFVSHRLGSINSVKQQVKHMYATMTEYYAKNSQLANTFNLNVVKEITENIEEELLNEGVRQYKQFYQSNEPLSGLKGKEIVEERKTAKVLSDDEIKQIFKTGLYKISKSMYGYCTKGNLCDKKEAIDPTFCGASCSTMIITKENAQNWQKLYFRNKKLLNTSNDLMIAGIPMNAAKTTMQSQNEVAKKIMNDFNMKYED